MASSSMERKPDTIHQRSRSGSRRFNQSSNDYSRPTKSRGIRNNRETVGNDSPSKRNSRRASVKINDFRARYWSYLFENFHRAVDEIYSVCEVDESELECQEMIMMLEVCRKDFEALIKRFKMQREYERKDGEGRSLAWEVRKSPAKRHGTFESYMANQERTASQLTSKNSTSNSKDVHVPVPPVDDSILSHHNAAGNCSTATDTVRSSSSGERKVGDDTSPVFTASCSWADRVRGYSLPLAQNKSESGTGGVHKNETQNRPESGGTGGVHRNEAQNRPESGSCDTEHRNQSIPTAEDLTAVESKNTCTIPQKTSPPCNNNNKLDSNSTQHSTLERTKESHILRQSLADEESEELLTDAEVRSPIKPSNASLDNDPLSVVTGVHTTTTITNSSSDSEISSLTTDPPLVAGSSHPPQASFQSTSTKESWKDVMKKYDEEREKSGGLLWADRCDSPPLSSSDQEDTAAFTADMRDTRSPGRAVQLHQKLSSPLRKKSTEQCIKTLEEKLVKAELFKVKKKEEIAQKSKTLSEKIRGVQESRNSITMQKKEAMEEKLERAEKLRVSHLQEIVRKAQEEDLKVNEIAFINSLEAQNKKIEVLERHQGVEARLQDMQEERQKKIEENQAKEEAAQVRRKALEAERKAKLQELDQKRKEQDAKFEQMKQEKEKAREEAAKERERKLEARHAALLLSTEELEKKIQMKYDSSSKRYDQHLEYKKERAQWGALSRHSSSDYAPCVKAYQKKKWCSVCNVKIVSEVYLMSHLKGKKHRECLLANGVAEEQADIIILAPDSIQRQTVTMEVEERMKAGKKRAKKLRQKMSGRTREGEMFLSKNSPTVSSKHHQRFTKLIKSINRFLDSPRDTQTTNVEKTLTDLTRALGSKTKDDQTVFCQLGGLTSLCRLLLLYSDFSCSLMERRPNLPEKLLMLTLSAVELACTNHAGNSQYMVLSNKVTPIIDLLHRLLTDSCRLLFKSPLPTEHHTSTTSSFNISSSNKSLINLCGSLLNVLAVVISSLVTDKTKSENELDLHAAKDCISYVVSLGLIDQMAEYFRSVNGPVEETSIAHMLISGLNMMLAFTALLHLEVKDIFDPKPQDQTQIISVLRQTEFAGILSLLYALLLHDGPPRHSSVPPVLPPYILSITAAGIRTINNSSIVDLQVMQNCLGAEGISLEFRHILGYLLWYCTHHHHEPLLHELILAVGYFSVLNAENQMFLLAGRSPTLLQLLCRLPFEYFSDPKLEDILYPTLISSCYNVPDSKDVLKLEMNCQLLSVYLKTKIDKAASQITTEDLKNFISLKYRFPEMYWQSAMQFFNDAQTQT